MCCILVLYIYIYTCVISRFLVKNTNVLLSKRKKKYFHIPYNIDLIWEHLIKICLNNRFIIYTKVKPILTINSEPLIFVNISLFLYSRRYFEGFFRFFFFILINCMTDMYISWTFIPCNIRVTSTDLSWIFTPIK